MLEADVSQQKEEVATITADRDRLATNLNAVVNATTPSSLDESRSNDTGGEGDGGGGNGSGGGGGGGNGVAGVAEEMEQGARTDGGGGRRGKGGYRWRYQHANHVDRSALAGGCKQRRPRPRPFEPAGRTD